MLAEGEGFALDTVSGFREISIRQNRRISRKTANEVHQRYTRYSHACLNDHSDISPFRFNELRAVFVRIAQNPP
jgi:hypothetical protein